MALLPHCLVMRKQQKVYFLPLLKIGMSCKWGWNFWQIIMIFHYCLNELLFFTFSSQSFLITTSFYVQMKAKKDIPNYVKGSQMVYILFPSYTVHGRKRMQ